MTVEPIDAYVAALEAALRGPRRARSDMLTETRDSLIDATEAYQHQGMERIAAERRAVREFGEVDVIAPRYQTELGVALTAVNATPQPLFDSRGVVWLVVFLLAPLAWVAASGRRCLRMT